MKSGGFAEPAFQIIEFEMRVGSGESENWSVLQNSALNCREVCCGTAHTAVTMCSESDFPTPCSASRRTIQPLTKIVAISPKFPTRRQLAVEQVQ